MKPSPRLTAILRWLLLSVAGLATLVAAFVVEENWRGDRAWAAIESDLKARGEQLEFSAYLPKPVPDEQNFFKTPLLASVLYDPPSDEKDRVLAETHLKEFYFQGHSGGTPTDLTVFRDHLKNIHLLAKDDAEAPAAGILTAFRPLQPLLDEMREAARTRPVAVHEYGPQPYERPWLDTNAAFELGQALAFRASAELALDRTGEAYADIFAALRLANGLSAHPSLMEVLVGQAILGSATRPISEGRQHRAWSEGQLAGLQHALSEVHPLTAFRTTIRAQRAASLHLLDALPNWPTVTYGHMTVRGIEWPIWFFHGWAQQNKVALSQHFDDDILTAFTVTPERIFPERVARAKEAALVLGKSHSPCLWVAKRAIQNVGGLLDSIGQVSDPIAEAAVACALERHRLAHGSYPGKLEELVPAFLPAVPTGIFDGQPLHYSKLPQDRYQIYSFGPNGHDDGGTGDDIVLKAPEGS
jgi:hypothetical protein